MSDPVPDAPETITAAGGEQPVILGRDPRPVCVIVPGRARPDQIEQVKTALMKIADPTRANPDCLDFRVYQNRYDPQSFVLWERWVSEQALLDHGKSDYMAEYNAQKDRLFESLGAGNVDGGFFQEIHRQDAAL
jgi:quinol monooxygenase YgiN